MDDNTTRQPQPEGTQLVDNKHWDKHNKRAEKAAQVFQEHITSEGQAPKRKKSGGKRRWLIVAGVLVVLAGVGGVVYVLAKSDGKKEANVPAATDNTESSSTGSSSGLASSETKDYTAAQLGLSLKYPSDWTVDEATGEIIFRSPSAHLPGTKPSVWGLVEVTIRAKGQPLPEFESGNATATRQSELLTYAKPSQNQRANSHLTFVAYAPEANGLNAMYITGDNGYQKGQAVPQVDIANMDPVISVAFLTCGDEKSCTNASQTSLEVSAWDDQEFSSVLKSMLQSIIVQ